MKSCKLPITTIAAILIAATLFAQVSSQAPSAKSSLATIEGVITKVEVLNSRVNLYLGVTDPNTHRTITWTIETGSLSELNTHAIKLSDLKAGVVIRAKGMLVGENRLEVPASEISLR